MNAAEFERAAQQILDFLCEYIDDIEDRPIKTSFPEKENLFAMLPKDVPEQGESFDKVFNDLKRVFFRRIVHWNHPLNFGPFPSPNSFPTILADFIVTAIGGVGFSYKSCPALTELELLMNNWYARFLGISESLIWSQSLDHGIGVCQQSVSDAIYTTLLAARFRALKMFADKKLKYCEVYPKREKILRRFILYAPKDCNFAIKKMCRLEYIYFRQLPLNPETGTYDYNKLKKQIESDVKYNMIPLMIVCNIGSFSKFAVDPVEKIKKLMINFPMCWIHCDASFGGNAMALDQFAYMRQGLDYADSIVVCPHKWLHVGIDSTVLWIKNAGNFQDAFLIHRTYLKPDVVHAIDLRNYGIALSRRFRALKMWFTFCIYGTKMLKTKLEFYIQLAGMFAERLKKLEMFEVLLHKFTFVNFILKNQNKERQLRFLDKINSEGRMLISHCYYDEFPILRFTVTYEYTNESHIETAVKYLFEAAKSFGTR